MQQKAYYQSPIGNITLVGQDGYVTSLHVDEDKTVSNGALPGYMEAAVTQLDDYFKGKLKHFDIAVRKPSTPAFTHKVWDALAAIPYGERHSYAELAEKVGNSKAARAVGNACNRNPLPLIVPCHRVVGSKGDMTGFALGIWRKEWLLAHEQGNKG